QYSYTVPIGKQFEKLMSIYFSNAYGLVESIRDKNPSYGQYDLYVEPTLPVVNFNLVCTEDGDTIGAGKGSLGIQVFGRVKVKGRNGQLLLEKEYRETHSSTFLQGFIGKVDFFNAQLEDSDRIPPGNQVEAGPYMV